MLRTGGGAVSRILTQAAGEGRTALGQRGLGPLCQVPPYFRLVPAWSIPETSPRCQPFVIRSGRYEGIFLGSGGVLI